MYEPATAITLAQRVVEALAAGCQVVIGDSPGGDGWPAFLHALRHQWHVLYADFVDMVGYTVRGERNDSMCGPSSTALTAPGFGRNPWWWPR